MEFSADDLPLPTVLYTGFHSADREPPEVTLEKAASYLVALKLYTGFHSADREPPEVTLEKAASYLVALKQGRRQSGARL